MSATPPINFLCFGSSFIVSASVVQFSRLFGF